MSQSEQDKMVMIKVLYVDLRWSFRRIARLFEQSQNTITAIYHKYLEQTEEEKLNNSPNSRGVIDLRYIGDSRDLEYLDTVMYHNDCGGGRRAKRSEGDSEA